MASISLQPRLIRVGQAPAYCGMSDRVFESDIRPFLTEIPVGVQGKAFDRHELDKVLDGYVAKYGRAPEIEWENKNCKSVGLQGSGKSMVSGISTRQSTVNDFAKAAKQAKRKKPKNC